MTVQHEPRSTANDVDYVAVPQPTARQLADRTARNNKESCTEERERERENCAADWEDV